MIYRFILLAFLYPVISTAGDIYKCKDGDGAVTYSQRPCSPRAEKIEVKAHKPTGLYPTDEENAASRAEDFARWDRKTARNKEVKRLVKQRNRQLKNIDTQINQVNHQKSLSANNYAGATRDVGLNTQLAELKTKRIDVEMRYQELINTAKYPPD